MDASEEKHMASSESNSSDPEDKTSNELSEKAEYAEQPPHDIRKWFGPEEKFQWNTHAAPLQVGPMLKRPPSVDDFDLDRPFKRQAGPINFEYVDILNESIEEAASQVYFKLPTNFQQTQLGVTHWSSLEKAKLYASLSILGKRNLRALSAHIGTKSILEVQTYLQFIRRAAKWRHETDKRSILPLTDYPAAAELSQFCCYELEKAADSLALSQQVVEGQKEYQKWKDLWDISPAIAEGLERKSIEATLEPLVHQFATLFKLSQWLELSCRVFMNSSVPANNWSFVDDKPPSIWATALEDFYSLTVSFTKRLVHATLQASESRRVNKAAQNTPHTIELEDVEVAVEMLGVSSNSKESWRTCPRRLRLNISGETRGRHHLTGDGDDYLSYHDVENMLGDPLHTCGEPEHVSHDDVKNGNTHKVIPTASDDDNATLGPADYGTDQEIRDILVQTRSARIRGRQDYKSALVARVVAERRQTAYADEFDTIRSQRVEAELWAIMGKDPPVGLNRTKDVLGRAPRSNWKLDEVYRSATDWATELYDDEE